MCQDCQNALSLLGTQCGQCALPLDHNGICGHCLVHPPPAVQAWAAYRYQGALAHALPALKFHKNLAIAPALGQALAATPCPLDLHDVDCLIPAPLHLQRLRQRGFNQALELCRPLAHQHRLEIRQDILRRRVATAEQSRLNARQRQINVKNAFDCRTALQGEHVLLFDDVMTTGATMWAMARCLLDNGAGQVSAIALARAV